MASSERKCVCGTVISRFRRASVTKCDECKGAEKQKQLKSEHLVLVHSCLVDAENDRYTPGCVCRKTVDKDAAFDLIATGDCISLTTRQHKFDGGPIIYVGSHSRTPRSPTIEANHIAYATGSMAPSKKGKRRKTETRTIEELAALEEENRASLAEEARVRIEEYHRLDQEAMKAITKVYTKEDFYRRGKEDWGRGWLFDPSLNS
jgi:hypothetical protein